MKVLLTGISGHIGGAIAETLLESGHEVIGVSRSEPIPSLQTRCKCYAYDIATPDFVEALQRAIPQCDAVVHAAACQDNNIETPQISRVNALGTHQVLQLSMALGARQYTYISSLSFLGLPQQSPITETHPIHPPNGYAASKWYGEQLSMLAGSEILHCTALRVSSPVGPGLHYRRIFRIFVEKALRQEAITLHGQGTRQQDYVDVRDIAQAVALTLNPIDRPIEAQTHSVVYNIGSGYPVSNYHLAEACVNTLASASKITFSGAPDPLDGVCWRLSIKKAQAELHYEPQFSLESSIQALAKELQET